MPPTSLPDPSKIGPIAQPPFAILPDPVRAVFARRAERLDHLARDEPPRALPRASSPTLADVQARARRDAAAGRAAARGAGRPGPREPDAADRPPRRSPRTPRSPRRSTRCSRRRGDRPCPSRRAPPSTPCAAPTRRRARWLLAQRALRRHPRRGRRAAPLGRRRGAGPRRPPRRDARRRPARADPRRRLPLLRRPARLARSSSARSASRARATPPAPPARRSGTRSASSASPAARPRASATAASARTR